MPDELEQLLIERGVRRAPQPVDDELARALAERGVRREPEPVAAPPTKAPTVAGVREAIYGEVTPTPSTAADEIDTKTKGEVLRKIGVIKGETPDDIIKQAPGDKLRPIVAERGAGIAADWNALSDEYVAREWASRFPTVKTGADLGVLMDAITVEDAKAKYRQIDPDALETTTDAMFNGKPGEAQRFIERIDKTAEESVSLRDYAAGFGRNLAKSASGGLVDPAELTGDKGLADISDEAVAKSTGGRLALGAGTLTGTLASAAGASKVVQGAGRAAAASMGLTGLKAARAGVVLDRLASAFGYGATMAGQTQGPPEEKLAAFIRASGFAGAGGELSGMLREALRDYGPALKSVLAETVSNVLTNPTGQGYDIDAAMGVLTGLATRGKVGMAQPTTTATALRNLEAPGAAAKAPTVTEQVSQAPGEVGDVVRRAVDWVKGTQYPEMTRENPTAAAAASGVAAAPMTADYATQAFLSRVRKATNVRGKTEAKFFAAALQEQLESIGSTGTVIGRPNAKGKVPLKDAAEFESIVASPEYQAWAKAFQGEAEGQYGWEQMFRRVSGAGEEAIPTTRGSRTGIRVSLAFDDGSLSGVGQQGNTGNAKLKRSRFQRRATGTGTDYLLDPEASITAKFRDLEAKVQKLNLYDELTKAGDAVVVKGKPPEEIKGEPAVRIAATREPRAGDPSGTDVLYVRESMADEVRRSLKLDDGSIQAGPVRMIVTGSLAGPIDNIVNGLNDAMVVASTPGAGIRNRYGMALGGLLNNVVAWGRTLRYMAKMPGDVAEREVGMSRIGAQQRRDPTKWTLWDIPAGAATAGFTTVGKVLGYPINRFRRAARLVLDDTFTEMVRRGEFDDNPALRREFINRTGNYVAATFDRVTRGLGSTGVFITSGKKVAAEAGRKIFMPDQPGAKRGWNRAAGFARANSLLQYALATAVWNTYSVGDPAGRKGVPFGAWDLGGDENGKPRYYDLPAMLLGYRKVLQATGLGRAMDAKRLGLSRETQIDRALQSIGNAWGLRWISGPPSEAASRMVTGHGLYFGSPTTARKTLEGESQMGANLYAALKGVVQSAATTEAGVREYAGDEGGPSVKDTLESAAVALLPRSGVADAASLPKRASWAKFQSWLQQTREIMLRDIKPENRDKWINAQAGNENLTPQMRGETIQYLRRSAAEARQRVTRAAQAGGR